MQKNSIFLLLVLNKMFFNDSFSSYSNELNEFDLPDITTSNNFENIIENENEQLKIQNNILINEDINNNYYINNKNNILDKKTTNYFTILFFKNSLDKNFTCKNNDDFSDSENGNIYLNSIPKQREDIQKKFIPIFSIKKFFQHSKYSEDNKMIKIRTFLGNNIHRLLNGLLEKDKLKLIKLEPKLFHESLKKDYILKIWNTTLKDIYLTTKISTKYHKLSIYEKDINIKIINKIYNDNTNKEVIQILNLTYGEIFEIFIRDIKPMSLELSNRIYDSVILNISKFERTTEFFQTIKEKEINNKEGEKYINEIKDLCLNFINWFHNKKGRKRV